MLESIGAGGGGEVFKAKHERMGRVVAIKILPAETMSNPAAVKRFQREVKTAARLMHPNIVTAFDAGVHGDTHFLVMEYVDGVTLTDYVREVGPLPVGRAASIIAQSANGVGYAHQSGVIHRDVKPSNIMLHSDDVVKILDMGLAIFHDLTSPGNVHSRGMLTEHGYVMGTAAYISPEQISNSHDVDHRADIYSLGCTLYFLLTGKAPYSGTFMEMLLAHTHEEIPCLQDIRQDVPRDMDLLFQKMVGKAPADRIQSMDQVAKYISRFAAVDSPSPQLASRPRPSGSTVLARSSSTLQNVQTSIGFDLGTTDAYVSWINQDGVPVSVVDDVGRTVTPTVVKYGPQGFEVGQAVIENVSGGGADVASHFLGDMGNREAHYVLRGKRFPAELLAAVVLKKLAANARQKTGYFSHVGYTFPNCFSDSRRHALECAFNIAGIETLEPVSSATASAAYFSFLHGWLNPLRASPPKHLLVIRYGAGSFDASLIRAEDHELQTLATTGDQSFGGNCWDERIFNYVVDQLQQQQGSDVAQDPAELYRLRRQCELAKVALTGRNRISVEFQVGGKAFAGVITRGFLHKVGVDLLERLQVLLDQTISLGGIGWQQVDNVLLTGGTTKMPLVGDFVKNLSGSRGNCLAMDPEAAPHGAALFAKSQIEPNCQTLQLAVRDRTPRYIGVLVGRGDKQQVKVVIPANSELPIARQISFRTSEPNQRDVAVRLVDGCGDPQEGGCTMGTLKIAGLTPGLPTGAPIELDFHVANSGKLSVFFESASTGKRSSLTIERDCGLSTPECQQWREWLDTGMLTGRFD